MVTPNMMAVILCTAALFAVLAAGCGVGTVAVIFGKLSAFSLPGNMGCMKTVASGGILLERSVLSDGNLPGLRHRNTLLGIMSAVCGRILVLAVEVCLPRYFGSVVLGNCMLG